MKIINLKVSKERVRDTAERYSDWLVDLTWSTTKERREGGRWERVEKGKEKRERETERATNKFYNVCNMRMVNQHLLDSNIKKKSEFIVLIWFCKYLNSNIFCQYHS